MAINFPPQYNQLMPYLILNGTAEFQRFMESVFDARKQLVVPNEEGDVMHGELRITSVSR